MSSLSPFADDRRDTLIAHFKLVMHSHDPSRRQAVIDLMETEGFSKAELSSLYIEATMRMDEVPDDFVPDITMIEAQREQDEAPHPLECMCTRCRGA